MTPRKGLDYFGAGMHAIQAGERPRARRYFWLAVQQDPQDHVAWLWLANLARDESERAYHLEQVLAVQPTHALAVSWLQRLREAGVTPCPPSPESFLIEPPRTNSQQS